MKNVYIIAEIGVNHNGDIQLAKRLIDEAKSCGADAVKFQTFQAKKLVSPNTPKVPYQLRSGDPSETHYQMIQKLELSYDHHYELFDYCKAADIDFLSTPYDIDSAKFLLELGIPYFKTCSADIVDHPLHHYIASTGLHCFISVGMATYSEIQSVVDIYRQQSCPFTLLHCVSNYPCSINSLNLSVIPELSQRFQCDVGFSDHSLGSLASSLSVALNATVIEKHFTLDKRLNGPDHAASDTPEEFKDLVKSIRKSSLILGSSYKEIQDEEAPMRSTSRKSLHYSRDLPAGHILDSDDLILLRPGTGLYYADIGLLSGKCLISNVTASSLATLDDVK